MRDTPPKTVLVTGAGSGLGRGMCIQLARDGHTIIATDIDGDAADQTVTMLTNATGCRALKLDVTSRIEVESLSDVLGDQAVDVLINNAGLQHVAPLESFPQERWDMLLGVMLHGPCMLTRALLPTMRERGFGRIINIGSIHSLVASPYKSAYVAAKHGMLGFSKVVALESADTDITINTVCPSYIRTPLVDKQIAAQSASHGIPPEQVIDQIMLGPMPKKAFITVEEVASAVRFLISYGARNITGQSIVIDGGWTLS